MNNKVLPAEFGLTIHPDEYEKLLVRASRRWPPPPSVPPNWSCTWSEWEALPSYYLFSPYYLMLPQIELHVNLQYGIRGETRPILFSNEREAFVFTIMDSNNYFLFDGSCSALYCIEGVSDDHQLAELLVQGDDALVTRLKAIDESEEGLSAIQRIMARDETVIPLLAEKFLHYTPVPTTPGQERNVPDSSPDQDAQFAQYVSRWQEEEDLSNDVRYSDELQKLDKEIGRLGSIIDGSSTAKRSIEMEEGGKLKSTEDGDEADVRWVREELSKFAEVTEVATEDDIPPEELENIKRDTNVLKTKINEIFKEMEEHSKKTEQMEDLKAFVVKVQPFLERSDELPLTHRHAMALLLACHLEKKLDVLKNPKI